MASVSTNIRLDSELKKESAELLKGLGLSLTDAVSMFLRQVVLTKGLPFEVRYPEPRYLPSRAELALEEARRISHDPKVKSYTDIDELFRDLDA